MDTGCFGGCGHLGDAVAPDQFGVVRVAVHRVGDGEFHLPLSLAERRRRACKIPRDIYTIICNASWATCWSVLPPKGATQDDGDRRGTDPAGDGVLLRRGSAL